MRGRIHRVRAAESHAPRGSRQSVREDAVQQLQRQAGNAAVAALLTRRVQRQEAGDTEASVELPAPPRLPPDIVALLDRIAAPSGVGGVQALTATTGAQLSAGEFTHRALDLWRRDHLALDDAYRRSAAETLGGTRPTQGGDERPARASAHWELLLAAWNYRNAQYRARRARSDIEPFLLENPDDRPGRRPPGNLPDIREMLRRGSPYRRAVAASYDHNEIVENPTASAMSAAILGMAERLAQSLPQGGTGRLTVNFQGHGGGGAITGVDDRDIDPDTLLRLAEHAEGLGVQVTYVLDTCNAGACALLAEEQEFNTAESGVPPGLQTELAPLASALRQLYRHGESLNDIAYQLRYASRNPEETPNAWTWLEIGVDRLQMLQQDLHAHPDIDGFMRLAMLAIPPWTSFGLLQEDMTLTKREVERVRGGLAPLLDEINAVLARGTDTIRARIERSGWA
jgi:hypothetical protein